jgi:hypothetical protein
VPCGQEETETDEEGGMETEGGVYVAWYFSAHSSCRPFDEFSLI